MKELVKDLSKWRFFFKNSASKEAFKELEKAVKESRWNDFATFKTTTGRRRIYLFQPSDKKEKYLIKAYLAPGIFKQLKYLVRASRCEQEFIASEKLTRLGFDSVLALFFGYERERFGLRGAELVLEPFLQEKSFEEIWKQSEEPKRRKLFKELADWVVNLHQQGVLQRDFKPDSMLVKEEPGAIKFIISDLERIKFYSPPLRGKKRINNLGKIIQTFFILIPSPEMSWFLEEYYSRASLKIKREEFFSRVILSGRKHLLKLAKQRKSWAEDTNELIERYFVSEWEVRRFKSIDPKWLEQRLKNHQLKPGQSLDWQGNQLKIFPAQNPKAVMETYFFLRELKIPAFQVALALSSPKGDSGLVGIIHPREAVSLKEFLEKERDRKKLILKLGRWLFRLEFLGVMPEINLKENLFVVKIEQDDYQLAIARADRVKLKRFLPSLRKLVPASSSLINQLMVQLFLSAKEKEILLQGFEQEKALLCL